MPVRRRDEIVAAGEAPAPWIECERPETVEASLTCWHGAAAIVADSGRLAAGTHTKTVKAVAEVKTRVTLAERSVAVPVRELAEAGSEVAEAGTPVTKAADAHAEAPAQVPEATRVSTKAGSVSPIAEGSLAGKEFWLMVAPFHGADKALFRQDPANHPADPRTLALIRRRNPEARIVFVTVHEDALMVERGLSVGALGYVLKETAGRDLVPAVRAALAGERYVSRALSSWKDEIARLRQS